MGRSVIEQESAVLIRHLQLLIARAAQKDSLGWWDDESLTQSGTYVLERLFPSSPSEIACKMALAAASARHQAAFADNPHALHLYALDLEGQAEFASRTVPFKQISVATEPIATIAELEQQLSRLVPDPRHKIKSLDELSNRRLAMRLQTSSGELSAAELAKMLAWTYLDGKPGEPVFPFLSTN